MRPEKELALQLFVHIPNDQMISLNHINLNASIGDLKSTLELRVGILSDLQDLYINNIKFLEKETLLSLKLKNGAILQLKFKEKIFRNLYIDAFKGDCKKVFKHEIEAIHGEECNLMDEVSTVLNKMASLKAFQAAFTACFKGHVAILTKIITKNSAVVANVSKYGRSLLHIAADAGSYPCIPVLLKNCSQLCTKKDINGFTALHLATINGHIQCEKYLAAHNLKFFSGDSREKSEKFFPPILSQTSKVNNVNNVNERKKLNQELPTLEKFSSKEHSSPELPLSLEQLPIIKQPYSPELLPTLEQLSSLEPITVGNKILVQEKEGLVKEPTCIQNQVPRLSIKSIQSSKTKLLFRSTSAPHLQTSKCFEYELNEMSKTDFRNITYTNQENKSNDEINAEKFSRHNDENKAHDENLACDVISEQLLKRHKDRNEAGMSEMKFFSSSHISSINMNNNTTMFTRRSFYTMTQDEGNTKRSALPHVAQKVENKLKFSKSFSRFAEYPKFVGKKMKVQNIRIKSKPSKNKKLGLKQTKVPDSHNELSLEANFSFLKHIRDGNIFFLESSDSSAFLASTVVNKDNIFLSNQDKLQNNIKNAEIFTLDSNKFPTNSSPINKASFPLTNNRNTFKVQSFKFETKNHIYQKTSFSVHKIRRREVKRMTFEEWMLLKKQLPNKTKISETSSVANPPKSKIEKAHAVSFETWLQRKRAYEELKKRKQAELDSKKENETAFMRNSRYMDPHQRTFEEWIFEKKNQQKHQIRNILYPKVSFAEDNELIFNLWLLEKFKSEIQAETELLMKERRSFSS